jgi:hypothetical protein
MRTIVLLLSVILASVGISARAQEESSNATLATPPEASIPAAKGPSWTGSTGRMFFPHNWIRGYVGFDVAPPYNEPDLGRCSQSQQLIAQAGGASSPCTAYARYLMSGYLEIQPLGRTIFRHLFVFYEPTFSFGNNVPQYKYTASMAGIAYERSVGVGFELPWNFEIRATQHQVDWLGKFAGNVGGPAGLDLGTAGPYGLYATVGARWYFGGYGRSHEQE